MQGFLDFVICEQAGKFAYWLFFFFILGHIQIFARDIDELLFAFDIKEPPSMDFDLTVFSFQSCWNFRLDLLSQVVDLEAVPIIACNHSGLPSDR